MKPAFVVTVHQSEQYRPDGHNYLKRYLETQDEMMEIDYDVFIMENASEKKYQSPSKYHYHYFPNQNGGMTRAWNVGVSLAIENKNDFICVTNEDIFFNKTINKLFEIVPNIEDKDNIVYGPVCDNPTTFPHQISAKPTEEIKDITGTDHGIHGWFTGFTSDYYHKYNVDGNIFEPEKIWRGQEKFQYRDWAKGARSYVIGPCLVHHDHTGSWKKTIHEIRQY